MYYTPKNVKMHNKWLYRIIIMCKNNLEFIIKCRIFFTDKIWIPNIFCFLETLGLWWHDDDSKDMLGNTLVAIESWSWHHLNFVIFHNWNLLKSLSNEAQYHLSSYWFIMVYLQRLRRNRKKLSYILCHKTMIHQKVTY